MFLSRVDANIAAVFIFRKKSSPIGHWHDVDAVSVSTPPTYVTVSPELAVQALPLFCGGGAVQVLVRILVPEQEPLRQLQLDQLSH